MGTEATYDLLAALREECDVLERLALAVTTLELLLVTGESRFVVTAVDEAEALRDAVGHVELTRAVAASRLADELGLHGEEPTLGQLAAALPDDMAALLRNLGDRLRAVTDETGARAAGTLAVAAQRLAGVRASLAGADASSPAPGYDGSGSLVLSGAALPPVVFDTGA